MLAGTPAVELCRYVQWCVTYHMIVLLGILFFVSPSNRRDAHSGSALFEPEPSMLTRSEHRTSLHNSNTCERMIWLYQHIHKRISATTLSLAFTAVSDVED